MSQIGTVIVQIIKTNKGSFKSIIIVLRYCKTYITLLRNLIETIPLKISFYNNNVINRYSIPQ